jgi:hypothetical protein
MKNPAGYPERKPLAAKSENNRTPNIRNEHIDIVSSAAVASTVASHNHMVAILGICAGRRCSSEV